MYGLDLFSGIGGITKALEGYVTPIAYCENDRYAQAVLLSRMACGDIHSAPIWDDVKTLTRMHITPPEIIYGGFPCQDISVAGRGAGLEGKRSGLVFEIVRLADEIRPAFIFLENVPAIRTRGADIVVGELARLGYDCRWMALSAAEVGANHRRERWWFLAHTNGGTFPQPIRKTKKRDGPRPHGQDVADSSRGTRQRPTQRKTGHAALGSKDVADHDDLLSQRRNFESQFGPSDGSWWATEPNVGRVAHGVPLRVDRLRGLGNAVVPAQAREAFERLIGIK